MRIREIRQEKKIPVTDLAKMLNISVQCYYNYETGKRKLTANTAVELAKILGTTVEELYKKSTKEV